jgi:hypothetical protein
MRILITRGLVTQPVKNSSISIGLTGEDNVGNGAAETLDGDVNNWFFLLCPLAKFKISIQSYSFFMTVTLKTSFAARV